MKVSLNHDLVVRIVVEDSLDGLPGYSQERCSDAANYAAATLRLLPLFYSAPIRMLIIMIRLLSVVMYFRSFARLSAESQERLFSFTRRLPGFGSLYHLIRALALIAYFDMSPERAFR